MAPVLRHIDESLDHDLAVRELSARLFISPGQLTRLFVGAFGMPPKAYIVNRRIERAEVAGRAGFNSLSYFSREFKSAKGMSPSNYRRMRR